MQIQKICQKSLSKLFQKPAETEIDLVKLGIKFALHGIDINSDEFRKDTSKQTIRVNSSKKHEYYDEIENVKSSAECAFNDGLRDIIDFSHQHPKYEESVQISTDPLEDNINNSDFIFEEKTEISI